MTFQYKIYPAKRCGVIANAGEVDGEPGRRSDYNREFPNLIRLEVPLIEVKIAAFAVNSTITLNGWDSLRNTAYNVETILGSAHAETNLSRIVAPEHFSEVATVEQALKKLHSGRTDIFIHLEALVLRMLQTEEFKDFGIMKVGVMDDFSAYPFLHKKHAELVGKLTTVLQQMKDEGLLDQYYEQSNAKK